MKLPVVILREQAALLGNKTSGLVEAEVKASTAEGLGRDFEHRFYLVAPALNHYHYYLFTISHNAADVYPVKFYPKESEGEFEELHSENHLLKRLAEVFNSDDTKRVIRTLIAQSQSA